MTTCYLFFICFGYEQPQYIRHHGDPTRLDGRRVSVLDFINALNGTHALCSIEFIPDCHSFNAINARRREGEIARYDNTVWYWHGYGKTAFKLHDTKTVE